MHEKNNLPLEFIELRSFLESAFVKVGETHVVRWVTEVKHNYGLKIYCNILRDVTDPQLKMAGMKKSEFRHLLNELSLKSKFLDKS